MEELQPLFAFIPDYGATVVLLVFLALWHRRTKARDEMFGRIIDNFHVGLMECLREMKAPRD